MIKMSVSKNWIYPSNGIIIFIRNMTILFSQLEELHSNVASTLEEICSNPRDAGNFHCRLPHAK
jgi:hypothetical protein